MRNEFWGKQNEFLGSTKTEKQNTKTQHYFFCSRALLSRKKSPRREESKTRYCWRPSEVTNSRAIVDKRDRGDL